MNHNDVYSTLLSRMRGVVDPTSTSEFQKQFEDLTDRFHALFLRMRESITARHVKNAGSLCAIEEALPLVFEHLGHAAGASEVRLACRATKALFDCGNTRLAVCCRLTAAGRHDLHPSSQEIGQIVKRVIAGSPNVVDVVVRGGASKMFAVLPALSALKKVRKLTLDDNVVNGESLVDAMALAHSLRDIRGLEELRMSNNGLGVMGVTPLTLVSLPALARLRVLHLDDNGIGRGGGAFIARLLIGITGLRELCIDNNGIGPEGAAAIAPSLMALTGLRTLSMSDNGLDTTGVTALAPALRALTGLQKLDLSMNGIDAEGAAALAPSLVVLTGLRMLHLKDSELGSAGTAALVPSLMALTGLRDLDMSSCTLCSASATALAPALRTLTGLRSLYLHNNQIGPEGTATIVRSLMTLPGLRTLSVSENGIGEDGMAVIGALLAGVDVM